VSGSNYASLRHPDGPTTPAGLTAANVSSWHPTGQLTFDPNGGSLPLIHGRGAHSSTFQLNVSAFCG
jgi:hypothetical protein